MRIGLIRHFRVAHPLPRGWMTTAELREWRRQYDAAAAVPERVELGALRWDDCVSSDLERAVVTARAVFGGAVEKTELLREPEFGLSRVGDLRLPVWAWQLVLRVAWLTGHSSQRQWRDGFRRRVLTIADQLEARRGDILVVSHAWMMASLSAEFRRRGFAGPKLGIPKHATLYVFEKRGAARSAAARPERGE